LSTIFSIFFKAFSSIIDVFLEENLPPVFSGELHLIKAGDKSQQLFRIIFNNLFNLKKASDETHQSHVNTRISHG